MDQEFTPQLQIVATLMAIPLTDGVEQVVAVPDSCDVTVVLHIREGVLTIDTPTVEVGKK